MQIQRRLLIFSILSLISTIAACNPGQVLVPAETSTPSPAPAATISLTSTPSYAIDLLKFSNFPRDYDYLMTHQDEFAQSPDPIHQREAFDQWFIEELVPTLGPVEGRELNYFVDSIGDSFYGSYDTQTSKIIIKEGNLHFFYFKSNGNIYPVPCINYSMYDPNRVEMTYCTILVDIPSFAQYGFGRKEMLHVLSIQPNSRKMFINQIFYNRGEETQGYDFGSEAGPMIDSLGNFPDKGNYIRFGVGLFQAYE